MKERLERLLGSWESFIIISHSPLAVLSQNRSIPCYTLWAFSGLRKRHANNIFCKLTQMALSEAYGLFHQKVMNKFILFSSANRFFLFIHTPLLKLLNNCLRYVNTHGTTFRYCLSSLLIQYNYVSISSLFLNDTETHFLTVNLD